MRELHLIKFLVDVIYKNFTKQDIKGLCNTVETIIFTRCVEYPSNPDSYKYYVNLIKDEYKKLCKLIPEPKIIVPAITEFIIKEGNINEINIERINNILTNMTQVPELSFPQPSQEGYLDPLDRPWTKVRKIIAFELQMRKFKKENLLYRFLSTLRESEVKLYRAAFIQQQNENPSLNKMDKIRALGLVAQKIKEDSEEMMLSIARNSYTAPIFTNIIPTIEIGNNPLIVEAPKYYIVGPHQYLYGGNFPEYTNPITGQLNYTAENLYNLAESLKIDYKLDLSLFDLYKLCMERLNKFSTVNKQIYPKNTMLEYPSPLVQIKKYTSFINYTYRPRLNVKPPGEIYKVYVDTFQVTYGVPFKFNDRGVPVYSSKFINSSIKDFYYIEGPPGYIEYEDTDDSNFITSTKYILIEYQDSYGKKRLFREGVNPKKIYKKPVELFDGCNRFTTKSDCNDINSYNLDDKKCKWTQISEKKFKCISVEEMQEIKQLLDISKVAFKKINKKGDEVVDIVKTKLWEDAVGKSEKNIAQFIVIHKEITEKQIKDIAFQEKIQLTKYYEKLIYLQFDDITTLPTILEEPVYNTLIQVAQPFKRLTLQATGKPVFDMTTDELKQELNKLGIAWGSKIAGIGAKDIHEELSKLLIESRARRQIESVQHKQKRDIFEDTIMQTIRLPIIIDKYIIIATRQLIPGFIYLLEDNTRAVLTEKTDTELIFDNGQTYLIDSTIIRKIQPDKVKEYIYFNISKNDKDFLSGLPNVYQYTIIKNKYEVKENDIIINKVEHVVKHIPLEMLYLSYMKLKATNPELPDNTIDLNMIYDTLGTTLNCKYELDSNDLLTLQSVNIFPATLEAKIYSLKYSVDLIKLTEKVLGEIKLSDVINEYNKVLPAVKSSLENIIFQLEYGIEKNDTQLVQKFIKIATRYLINNPNESLMKLIKNAQDFLLKKQKKDKPKKQEDKKPEGKGKEKESTSVSYLIQRRRPKKRT